MELSLRDIQELRGLEESLWLRTPSGWQLQFHQGTAVEQVEPCYNPEKLKESKDRFLCDGGTGTSKSYLTKITMKRTMRQWFGEKFDGVIEAVHYTKNGTIDWVRAYERRGPTWSDHVLMNRATLLERLRAGKRFYTGRRIDLNASEFELDHLLKLSQSSKGEIIITDKTLQQTFDHLNGVPTL
jgi:hypothetical protein